MGRGVEDERRASGGLIMLAQPFSPPVLHPGNGGRCGGAASAAHMSLRKRTKAEVCEAFIFKLRERRTIDLDAPGVIEGIQQHFQLLPTRYGARGRPPACRGCPGVRELSVCGPGRSAGRQHWQPGCAQPQADAGLRARGPLGRLVPGQAGGCGRASPRQRTRQRGPAAKFRQPGHFAYRGAARCRPTPRAAGPSTELSGAVRAGGVGTGGGEVAVPAQEPAKARLRQLAQPAGGCPACCRPAAASHARC